MMSDHFPYNVSRALEICTDAYAVADQASSLHERGTQILEEAKKESWVLDYLEYQGLKCFTVDS